MIWEWGFRGTPFGMRSNSTVRLLVLGLIAACGGGGDGAAVDAVEPDARTVDAGAVDARAVDAADTCDPTAAPQPNVGLVEAAGEGGCPDGMVVVADFCVDKYEASLQSLAGAPWSPFVEPGDETLRAVSLAGAIPQAFISGAQAATACANASKRLCTDAEWLRACQGEAARTYPYGETRDATACSETRDVPPPVEMFGPVPATWDLGNACLDQLDDTLSTTGAWAGCVTPEGVLDLVGNVQEWTSDAAGTYRGGSFVDASINGPGCLNLTTAHDVDYADYTTGFRCCADLP